MMSPAKKESYILRNLEAQTTERDVKIAHLHKQKSELELKVAGNKDETAYHHHIKH